MNRGREASSGYTVVETLIFLAVSGLMFLMAMQFLSGQKAKNEFTAGVRDTQARIDAIINDVANGYYQSGTDFQCDTSALPVAQPVLSTGTPAALGAKKGCIFMGRVVQLAPDVSKGDESYITYSMIGRQFNASNKPSANLDDTFPVLLAPGITKQTAAPPNLPDTQFFGGGLVVKKMRIDTGSGWDDTITTRAFGIVGSLEQIAGGGSQNGQMRVDVFVPNVAGLQGTKAQGAFIDAFDTMTSTSPWTGGITNNPPGGIGFCLESPGLNRHAWINIGADGGSRLTTSVDYEANPC